ncbi:hypothetical protein CCH79_00010164 [Gambusia affinis]|uniref:Chemokine interleukin-8-like domain-containing protein n=1 Tax=Gambusia affinis TaxID=33528 RepID=A0A315VP56_GAMAF|nr:hypothetical protein CCH79_00010164 [Gambusia affinis]
MKTLTVGLLLLFAVCCCDAMRKSGSSLHPDTHNNQQTLTAQGPNALKPGKCCFHFFMGRIPVGEIRSIAKTHESCSKRGFVYVFCLTDNPGLRKELLSKADLSFYRINTPRGNFCVNVDQKWAIKAFLKTPKQVATSTSLPLEEAGPDGSISLSYIYPISLQIAQRGFKLAFSSSNTRLFSSSSLYCASRFLLICSWRLSSFGLKIAKDMSNTPTSASESFSFCFFSLTFISKTCSISASIFFIFITCSLRSSSI